MNVRKFRAADTAVLSHLHNQLVPDRLYTPPAFARYVARLPQNNGRFWVIAEETGTAVGYAAMLPIPGLPELVELEGGIVPGQRRQGYGRFLLRHVLQEMAATSFRQLSAQVPAPGSPVARFLQAHGFFLEHEEWTMVKEPLTTKNEQPALDKHSSFTVHTDWETAVATFLTLYDQAFAPHPWYQPFAPAEVQATLSSPADILFLQSPLSNHASPRPIGFAWLHLNGSLGEIEPIGIVPAWQGKGYGRILLNAALHQLAQRGAAAAQIAAWRTNTAAIHLYQSFGFRHIHTHTYLAYTLP